MTTPTRRILRLPALTEKVQASRDSIYRWAKTCGFPRPIKLGQRASGWYEDEVDAWLAKRAATRAPNTEAAA